MGKPRACTRSRSIARKKKRREKPTLSDDARLLSLVPQNGTLTPVFSPDVFEYSLTVPYEVTTMVFEGEPVEGATYRVNRKNLGSGGSDTLFQNYRHRPGWRNESRVPSHGSPGRKGQNLGHGKASRYHRCGRDPSTFSHSGGGLQRIPPARKAVPSLTKRRL